jgi:hypothetical protein
LSSLIERPRYDLLVIREQGDAMTPTPKNWTGPSSPGKIKTQIEGHEYVPYSSVTDGEQDNCRDLDERLFDDARDNY